MITYSAIILAAGKGSRTGFTYNKIFHKINDKFLVRYSIDYFKNDPKCTQLLLICNENDFTVMKDLFTDVVDSIFIGGKTRQESVYKALNYALKGYVLIHDSARPFINPVNVDDLLLEVDKSKACTLAVPVTNTVVKVSGNRLIKTLDRSSLLQLQTPQAFDRDILLNAHNKAIQKQYSATDDTDIVRQFTDIIPTYVMGDYRAIKLTTKEDIEFLEVIL